MDPETNQITHVTDPHGRAKWRVGETYAIQPGRGKHQVARFRLLAIKDVDVRNFRHEDAVAEGFKSQLTFWYTWCEMHDPTAQNQGHSHLKKRPDKYYDAWALRFELIRDSVQTVA